VTRLAGPVLLLGSVAAVWIGVSLGPLASPSTTQAATTKEVETADPVQPSSGLLLALRHEGDRLVLILRTGSGTVSIQVAPGVTTHGASLPDLTAQAAAGLRPQITLTYAADGRVSSIAV
jgi:hypothetical protein